MISLRFHTRFRVAKLKNFSQNRCSLIRRTWGMYGSYFFSKILCGIRRLKNLHFWHFFSHFSTRSGPGRSQPEIPAHWVGSRGVIGCPSAADSRFFVFTNIFSISKFLLATLILALSRPAESISTMILHQYSMCDFCCESYSSQS